ncbi:hypothetical protein [Candidatus Methanodesulfokora washburnensis]|nr:hypothetical protein [Candidatus Methanodesulfokores washburnensis]
MVGVPVCWKSSRVARYLFPLQVRLKCERDDRISAVKMLESKSSKDTCNLESRLIALLMHGIEREQDKTRNIYDVAWGIFALKDIGRNYKYLYDEARQVVSLLGNMNSKDLNSFLFDYRRAVGIALSIYLIGAENLRLSRERLDEICEILTVNSETSETGELIGATFLLLKHLKHEEMEKKIKEVMIKIRKSGFKDPAYYLADVIYVAFFSAVIGDLFYIETLEEIHKNEYLLEYIMDDHEKLALFLYIVSKATSLGDHPLVEWCKDKREEVAKNLRDFIEENSLILSNHPSIVNVLRDSTIDFEVYKQQNYRFVNNIGNSEIILDSGVTNSLFLRPDLISKMILALYEAGYLSPFMLSKKEADAYRQIRAEVKGYRRVRKYEMIFILISFALFMLLFPLTIYGLII